MLYLKHFISSNFLDLLLLARPAKRSVLVTTSVDKRGPYCHAPYTNSFRFENNCNLKNSPRMLDDALSAFVIHCYPVSFDRSFRTLDTVASRYLGLIPTLRECPANVCHLRCPSILFFRRPIPSYLRGFVEYLKIANTLIVIISKKKQRHYKTATHNSRLTAQFNNNTRASTRPSRFRVHDNMLIIKRLKKITCRILRVVADDGN